MRRPLPLLPLLAGLALACSTAVNPATGRREVVMASPVEEQKLDEEAAREIAESLGVVGDTRLSRYVQELGAQLATFSPRQDLDYHFSIVEMDEPNAFALPGGHIYVSRGLLVLANTESEVAHVLGHEIAHVAARHYARMDAHMKTLGLATLLSELIGGSGTPHPDDVGQDESMGASPFARYARNQERQADRIGQDIAARAGIEPGGMARFLTSLDNYTKLDLGFSMPQTYFATHPATPERMANAAARAQEEAWRLGGGNATRSFQSLREAREAYFDRIEGMAVTRPASEGVIQDGRFLHADLDFALRFPHDWEARNGATSVAAISPKRDAWVLLELGGPGGDPAETARSWAEKEGLRLRDGTAFSLGAMPAYRAQTVLPSPFGGVPAEITWVAHGELVYRLTGVVRGGTLKRHQPVFRRFVQSFRPLSEADRASIRELRLHTARAEPGETLFDLSARTGNEWDPTFTSVVNGIFSHEALAPGQRVKIAVLEPYLPESEREAERGSEGGGEADAASAEPGA